MQPVSARDYYWLDRIEAGATTAALAAELRVSRRNVQLALKRAREDRRVSDTLAVQLKLPDPYRVPLFPVTSFTPTSKCAHHGLISRQSVFVCMVCHSDRDGPARPQAA